MAQIQPLINQIAMLFLIAAVGLLMRKRGVFTDVVIKGINATMIAVTWPAMMFMIMQKPYTDEALRGFVVVLAASVAIMGAALAAALWLFKGEKTPGRRPVIAMLASMPNAGYIGLPIVQAVYGDAATLYLAAYIAGFNIVFWTLGAASFTGFSLKSLKGMLNPGFVATVLASIFFFARITLPTPVLAAVNQLGAVNTPLAMLLLGSRMDTLRFRQLLDGKLWLATAAKLLVVPLLALVVLRALGVSDMVLGLTVLASAMPAASGGQMLAEKYDADVGFAAKGVSLSTLACVATLPIILLALGA